MSVEVRRVETEYHETGVGQQPRTDVTYELGAEVDGAWVAFARVTESVVQRAQEQAKQQQASRPSNPSATQGTSSGEQQMTDVTPTPAPQAEAAQQSGSSGAVETQTA
jgi:hypothetical protein